MVLDSELVNRLSQILETSDLETTTAGAVRRQLEKDFGVDLSDRKKFISQQIDQILHAAADNGANDENVDQELETVKDEYVDGSVSGGVGHQEDEEGEDDEDDPEEEEESDEKPSKTKRSCNEETTKKKGGGFTKVCSLSPQLQEFLGVSELGRTEVVKRLWAYIKEKDLQDPKDRRYIKCDKQLLSIFHVDRIYMFQMSKALSKHIWPLEAEPSTDSTPQEKKNKRQKEEEPSTDSTPQEKKNKRVKEEEPSKPQGKKHKRQKKEDVESKQKGGTSGFLKPLQLSEAFIKFLGTGETSISRSDAVKRIWDYIKQNDLQDPSDRRIVLCDEKLKELLGVDLFKGFGVTKFLTPHLTKMEE